MSSFKTVTLHSLIPMLFPKAPNTPGGIRTPDTWYRKPLLYPLSYECICLLRNDIPSILPHIFEIVKPYAEIWAYAAENQQISAAIPHFYRISASFLLS